MITATRLIIQSMTPVQTSQIPGAAAIKYPITVVVSPVQILNSVSFDGRGFLIRSIRRLPPVRSRSAFHRAPGLQWIVWR